jgi:hypothetical protein
LNSCANVRKSNACWFAPASCCSSTGSKLSPIDQASIDKWEDYTEAKEAMFFYTDTADAPWTIVKSDDKKRARLECMRHFLSSLPYDDKDTETVGQPDPFIVTSSDHAIANSEHILGASLHPEQRRSKK